MHICFVLLFMLFGTCISVVPVIQTEPSSSVTNTQLERFIPFASDYDKVVTFDSVAQKLVIMKLMPDGTFSLHNTVAIDMAVSMVTTNGIWYAIVFGDTISFYTEIDGVMEPGGSYNFAFWKLNLIKLLSDDTFVLAAHERNNILTMGLVDGQWSLVHYQTFSGVSFYIPYSGAASMTDTTFAVFGISNGNAVVHLFQRGEDLKWELVYTFTDPMDMGARSTLIWNADLWFATSNPDSGGGTVTIHTAQFDLSWTATTLSGSEYGIAGFGLGLVYVDADRFLVGSENNSMWVIQRTNEVWNLVAEVAPAPLTPPVADEDLLYGANAVRNPVTHSTMIYVCQSAESNYDCYAHLLTDCTLTDETEITCQSAELSAADCADINYLDYVFVNTPSLCGVPVVQITDVQTTADGFLAVVTASRPLSADVSCQVTVTCLAPPAAPVAAPVTDTAPLTDAPVSDSPVGDSPVGSNSPVQGPGAAPNSQASGAGMMRLSAAVLGAVLVAL